MLSVTRTQKALAALAVSACSLFAGSSHTSAYTYNENKGLDSNGNRWTYPICATFPTLLGPSSPERTSGAARQCVDDAYDMWSRDGAIRRAYYTSGDPTCVTGLSNGRWFNGTCPIAGTCDDNLNETWWESPAIVDYLCDGNGTTFIGCEGTVRVLTCGGVGDACVNESDVALATGFHDGSGFATVNQNTIAECLSSYTSMETLALHEIGHSYGLGHESSIISLMHPNIQAWNHCHLGRGYSTIPFANEFYAKSRSNSTITTSSHNLTGTMWYRDSTVTTTFDSNIHATGTSFIVKYSLESYYNTIPGANVRIVLLPVGTVPSITWTGFSYTPAYTLLSHNQGSLSISAGQTKYVEKNVTMPANVIPAGNYRVWIHIDAPEALAETDEWDNMFPTNATVREY